MAPMHLIARAAILAALLVPQPTPAQPVVQRVDPDTLFAGHSEGHGTLRLGVGKSRRFQVSSLGTAGADGHLRLHQVVHFEGQAPSSRDWDLWPAGGGRFTGTLSDAAGRVHARVQGNRLTLHYPLNHGGLAMYQTLELQADGHSIDNRATVRFLGVPVGWLHETILRTP